ncbi:dehydrogenase/reductase SDR family member 7B isoform X1 [Tupaia chinensis]|uniref:dehydrogenase/reductase SDR family member 7B isoform X1 n=1 Tax=Tupaia chinensis TaxID=246437 RepID=UPI0003C909CB|nr:dehydrogenase/reductase SDR family member 7B isoform X1 [Tupaia chinensis]
MVPPATRRSPLKARVMDVITSAAILPLLLGCLGVFGLFRLLQWMRMKAYLRNAVVVITGATSGLGKECAKVFYAAGAKLVLCGRNTEALEELTQELSALRATTAQTHKPRTVTFDLTDPGAIIAAAAEILQCFGCVDILVNNAGISYRGAIMETPVDVDKRVMETNYFGPVALTKALLPSMIKRRQGHIIAISSIQGKISIPFRSAYAASKHATQAFFDCLRAEMEQYEIEVTVISPGYIHTNLSLNAITADGSRYGVTCSLHVRAEWLGPSKQRPGGRWMLKLLELGLSPWMWTRGGLCCSVCQGLWSSTHPSLACTETAHVPGRQLHPHTADTTGACGQAFLHRSVHRRFCEGNPLQQIKISRNQKFPVLLLTTTQ